MAKYVKKPVVIDAVQMPNQEAWAQYRAGHTVSLGNMFQLVNMIGTLRINDLNERDEGIDVMTNHGPALARPGDWLILSAAGELYPCSNEEFTKNYDWFDESVAVPMVVVSTFQTDQDGNHIEMLVPESELNAELVDVSQAYAEAMGVANECGFGSMSLAEVIRTMDAELATFRDVETGLGFNEVGETVEYTEETCPGHVASTRDPKVCGICGTHIDSLRPDDDDCA